MIMLMEIIRVLNIKKDIDKEYNTALVLYLQTEKSPL